MKTKLFFLLGILSMLVLSFCGSSGGNNSETNEDAKGNNSVEELDTAFDKYLGLYKYNNSYFSVGKFPANTRIKTSVGSKFLPIPKKFVGQYFLVEDNAVINRPFYCHTDKATDYAGGFLAPETGNILIGVQGDGTIMIQNYNNYGSKDGDTLNLKLGGTGPYGKFVPRSDGKYNISVNNVIYEWTQQ